MKTNKSLLSALAVIVLSFFSANVFAQDSSLLWRISGNGLDQPSYLYGTMHMLCEGDFQVSEELQGSLDTAERLVLELNIQDPNVVSELTKFSMNPDMRNLKEDLSAQQYAALDSFFVQNYGVGMEQLGVMRPFALLSMVLMKGFECPDLVAVEQNLIEIAEEKNWQIIGLETVEEQVAAIESASLEEQIEWLMGYVNGEESVVEQMTELREVYLSEDMEAIAEYMANSPEMEGFEEELLWKRNQNWIAPISELVKEKSTFIAVGAAHLGDEKGVIELLRKEGYTVEPIN